MAEQVERLRVAQLQRGRARKWRRRGWKAERRTERDDVPMKVFEASFVTFNPDP